MTPADDDDAFEAALQTIASLKTKLTEQLAQTREKLAQVTAAYQGLAVQGGLADGDEKAALRRAALARRGAVDHDTRERLAVRLAAVGADLVSRFQRQHGPVVTSLYCSIGSEPDVLPLARTLADAGTALALPVDWSHGGPLIYRRWTPGDRLAPGPLGIAEPLPSTAECEPDVLVLPVVGYDRRGHRIGYGAGNVDRTLKRLRARKTVLVIGVAYAVQEELVIPTDTHDQPADVIITERDTIVIEPSPLGSEAGS